MINKVWHAGNFNSASVVRNTVSGGVVYTDSVSASGTLTKTIPLRST